MHTFITCIINLQGQQYGQVFKSLHQHFKTYKDVRNPNTVRTGDANLRFYITTVQDG